MKRTVKILALAVAALLLTALPALAGCAFYDQNGHHNFDQVEFAYPSCETDGYYVIECQNCGITEKEITEKASGHDWKRISGKSPDCEDGGYAKYECRACGETKKETLKPLGHDWKEVRVITPATCYAEGEVESVCTVCGRESTIMTDKTSHSYGEWVDHDPKDGIGMGQRISSCVYCGDSMIEEYYPEGTLYRGAKNDKAAVKELQRMLRDLGFLRDKVDGSFGKNTERAVKDYQEHARFEPDGVAWPGIISAISIEWDIQENGVIPEPTPEPAPEPEAAGETYPCCALLTGEDGFTHIEYCQTHGMLVEGVRGLLSGSDSDAGRAKLLGQYRMLWESELDLLYRSWQELAEGEEAGLAIAAQAGFAAHLDMQEKVWQLRYGEDSVQALARTNELLAAQCAELCAMLHEYAPEGDGR